MRAPRWHHLLALTILAAQTGCQGLFRRAHHPADSGEVPSVPPMARSSKDLPAKETARVCVATADTLFKAGQDAEAITLYERARAVDPHQAQVCRRLAILYLRRGQNEKAEEEFEKARKMYPADAGLHNDLGYVCYCRGHYDEAERYLHKAVQFNPSHKRAWINLGLTLGQKNRLEESLAAFSNAVPPAQAHSNLGFLLLAQGRKEQARQCYYRALDLDPELTICRTALARLDGDLPPVLDPRFTAPSPVGVAAVARPQEKPVLRTAARRPVPPVPTFPTTPPQREPVAREEEPKPVAREEAPPVPTREVPTPVAKEEAPPPAPPQPKQTPVAKEEAPPPPKEEERTPVAREETPQTVASKATPVEKATPPQEPKPTQEPTVPARETPPTRPPFASRMEEPVAVVPPTPVQESPVAAQPPAQEQPLQPVSYWMPQRHEVPLASAPVAREIVIPFAEKPAIIQVNLPPDPTPTVATREPPQLQQVRSQRFLMQTPRPIPAAVAQDAPVASSWCSVMEARKAEARAHASLGFLLMAQGKKEQAKLSYCRALELDPELSTCRIALASLEARPPATPLREPPQLQQVRSQRFLTQTPRTLPATVTQDAPVVASWRSEAEVRKAEAQAHANLGFLLLAQGKKEQAKLSYRRALELDAELTVCRIALAHLEGATVQASLSLREPPQLQQLRLKWLQASNPATASGLPSWASPLAARKVEAQALCDLGFLLMAQGKVQQAKLSYRRALELDPELSICRTALTRLEGDSPQR